MSLCNFNYVNIYQFINKLNRFEFEIILLSDIHYNVLLIILFKI